MVIYRSRLTKYFIALCTVLLMVLGYFASHFGVWLVLIWQNFFIIILVFYLDSKYVELYNPYSKKWRDKSCPRLRK